MCPVSALTDVDWQVVLHYVFPLRDDIIPVLMVTLLLFASVKVTVCERSRQDVDLIYCINFCYVASHQLVGELLRQWW